MLSVLLCGAVVFPGLFYGFRKVLKHTFTDWSDADVVSVSERSVAPKCPVNRTLLYDTRHFDVVVLN